MTQPSKPNGNDHWFVTTSYYPCLQILCMIVFDIVSLINTLLVHAKFAMHICTNLTIHLIAAKNKKNYEKFSISTKLSY